MSDFAANMVTFFQNARLTNRPLMCYLMGEIGAGKTFFVRALLQAMGIQSSVKSPTYTLFETYTVNKALAVCHLDLYRLEDPESLYYLGLDWQDFQLALCEWPEKAVGSLPPADIIIDIAYGASKPGLNVASIPRHVKINVTETAMHDCLQGLTNGILERFTAPNQITTRSKR